MGKTAKEHFTNARLLGRVMLHPMEGIGAREAEAWKEEQ